MSAERDREDAHIFKHHFCDSDSSTFPSKLNAMDAERVNRFVRYLVNMVQTSEANIDTTLFQHFSECTDVRDLKERGLILIRNVDTIRDHLQRLEGSTFDPFLVRLLAASIQCANDVCMTRRHSELLVGVDIDNTDNRYEFLSEISYFKMSTFDQDDLNPFQVCIQHMRAQFNKFRIMKHSGNCYEELTVQVGRDLDGALHFNNEPLLHKKYTEESLREYGAISKDFAATCQTNTIKRFHTHCWQEVGTIEASVYTFLSGPENASIWHTFTQSQTMASSIKTFFAACQQGELSSLNRNRYLRVFQGSFMDVHSRTVYHYDPDNHHQEWEDKLGMRVACKYYNTKVPRSVVSHTHWWFIPTPHTCSINRFQRLSVGVQASFMSQMGKLCFPLNVRDRWETIFFVKGPAQSGKSTYGKAAKNFYQSQDVGVIANSAEKIFWGMSLWDKFLAICFEVKHNFSMDEATIQCIASGEDMSIPIKNQAAKILEWDVPLMLIGNELASWLDVSGSIVRRIFIVEYVRKVQAVDTELSKKIEADTGSSIWKSTSAYLSLCEFSKGRSVWDCMPAYFRSNQLAVAMQTNPVINFLHSSSTRFTVHKNWIEDEKKSGGKSAPKVPECVFKQEFHLWGSENGVTTKTQSIVNSIKVNLEQEGCELKTAPCGTLFQLTEGQAALAYNKEKWIYGLEYHVPKSVKPGVPRTEVMPDDNPDDRRRQVVNQYVTEIRNREVSAMLLKESNNNANVWEEDFLNGIHRNSTNSADMYMDTYKFKRGRKGCVEWHVDHPLFKTIVKMTEMRNSERETSKAAKHGARSTGLEARG